MRRSLHLEGMMGVLSEDGTCQRLDEEMTCVWSQMEPIGVHVTVSNEYRGKTGFPCISHIPGGLVIARDVLLRIQIWRRFKQNHVVGRHVSSGVSNNFGLQFLCSVDGEPLSFVRLSGVICQSTDDNNVSWVKCCLCDFVACVYELVCFVNDYVVLSVVV